MVTWFFHISLRLFLPAWFLFFYFKSLYESSMCLSFFLNNSDCYANTFVSNLQCYSSFLKCKFSSFGLVQVSVPQSPARPQPATEGTPGREGGAGQSIDIKVLPQRPHGLTRATIWLDWGSDLARLLLRPGSTGAQTLLDWCSDLTRLVLWHGLTGALAWLD
jgi:hypothetical protein